MTVTVFFFNYFFLFIKLQICEFTTETLFSSNCSIFYAVVFICLKIRTDMTNQESYLHLLPQRFTCPIRPFVFVLLFFLYEKCTSESFGALLVSMYDYSQELNCYENLYRQGIALLMVFCFSFPTESSGAAIVFFKCCLLKLYLLYLTFTFSRFTDFLETKRCNWNWSNRKNCSGKSSMICLFQFEGNISAWYQIYYYIK